MSYCKLKQTIEDGDTVVIYLSPRQMYRVKVLPNEVFQTRFGAIRLDQLIGKPYGCRIQCSKGFVHILDMTPELWTLTLPHRTQILYGPDISMILMHLQLKSGSTVIEAGTGSGSLSHSIARTITPHGKLFTFDFHEERVLTARKEFREHGIDSIVTIEHRDVCSDGFKNLEPLLVDAVFLDLPKPWEAIEAAQKVLKNGGRICCFSPCIEQVQKSCQLLAKLNFLDIETMECVLRPYEIRKVSYKKIRFCGISKRSNSEMNDDDNTSAEMDQDHKENDQKNNDEECTTTNDHIAEDVHKIINKNKKVRICNDERESKETRSNQNDYLDSLDEVNYWVTYMNSEVAGHTGFLTFATNFTENS